MSQEESADFALMRAEMVDVIEVYMRLSAEKTGAERLDARVLAALGKVPRHEFVPAPLRPIAYANTPLPIGYGKTISQPFIVALMTELLGVRGTDRVLEVGTGLGYQAAVLAELAERVYTVEIIEELASEARRRLDELGYRNIESRVGDGSHGWAEHAPFDKIIVTAAPELIPPTLIGQLKAGGRMVIPAGIEGAQSLILVTKDAGGKVKTKSTIEVSFTTLVATH